MKNYRKKASGSFLVDIMVAFGIMTLSISASLIVINQSVTSNAVNKNKIIAVNLAREGIEAIRVMRDTNWIRYGQQKRICWNFWDDVNENGIWGSSNDKTCTEDSTNLGTSIHPIGIAGGEGGYVGIKNFIVTPNTVNHLWTLVENFEVIPDSGDVENKISTYNTSNKNDTSALWATRKSTINSGTSLSSQVFLDSDGHYTHTTTGNTPTDFYREITIEYPDQLDGFNPYLGILDVAVAKGLDNKIFITSKVWYKGHGGKFHNVILESELTDYLDRTGTTD